MEPPVIYPVLDERAQYLLLCSLRASQLNPEPTPESSTLDDSVASTVGNFTSPEGSSRISSSRKVLEYARDDAYLDLTFSPKRPETPVTISSRQAAFPSFPVFAFGLNHTVPFPPHPAQSPSHDVKNEFDLEDLLSTPLFADMSEASTSDRNSSMQSSPPPPPPPRSRSSSTVYSSFPYAELLWEGGKS